MNIRNILVVSPMYQDLQTLIQEKKLHYNFRFLPEQDVTNEDFVWADSFVGFNLSTQYDYGQVQWVHSLGAGVDRFLHKKIWPQHVLLTRTICSFGQRIAEYCLSYILKDLQCHDHFKQLQQAQTWQPRAPKLLSQQKVMIYGTGEIGQKTAEVLAGFGVEVYGVSLSGKEKKHFKQVFSFEHHFSKLQEMDFIINTLPLTEKTEQVFNKEIFSHVSHVGFINVGRGASVNEEDLLHALYTNSVKFAVLDVFSEEPLPQNHTLWNHPRVIITPHISAVTTPREAVDCFVETLKRIEDKQPLKNQVDVRRGY
ncbi:D-2-hydroxyacid dehydrogenase [Bacillus suaedaesalsae]|uniref:D-2-hydroxyacid dehydrogenase n=1 Tax=Bacillus suaedaesalsae TaxID=2810349 RepID=A0ABS2DHA8_9BACI|nr:D-2-hydroxyacid dehydrogenase [Bacillus suaedaesalsae]MBM6617838.1 D-2-hydroxyacid dehydrogenase [Bacillus suaedaesalsae]